MILKDVKTQVVAALAEITNGLELDLARLDVGWASDSVLGDIATNAAMVYARDLRRSPRELAQQLAEGLQRRLPQAEKVEVAGPGFVNVWLTATALTQEMQSVASYRPDNYRGQVVVAEYSDANPFKVLHAGHVYTTVVGDAVANLLELGGGNVHRVNFGGDVGLHVGKTMWAILK